MPTHTIAEKRAYQAQQRATAKSKAEAKAKRDARKKKRDALAIEVENPGVGGLFDVEAEPSEEGEPPSPEPAEAAPSQGLAYGKTILNSNLILNHPDKLAEIIELTKKLGDFENFPTEVIESLKVIDRAITANMKDFKHWHKCFLASTDDQEQALAHVVTKQLEMVQIGLRLLEWGAETYTPLDEQHGSVAHEDVLASIATQMANRTSGTPSPTVKTAGGRAPPPVKTARPPPRGPPPANGE